MAPHFMAGAVSGLCEGSVSGGAGGGATDADQQWADALPQPPPGQDGHPLLPPDQAPPAAPATYVLKHMEFPRQTVHACVAEEKGGQRAPVTHPEHALAAAVAALVCTLVQHLLPSHMPRHYID